MVVKEATECMVLSSLNPKVKDAPIARSKPWLTRMRQMPDRKRLKPNTVAANSKPAP